MWFRTVSMQVFFAYQYRDCPGSSAWVRRRNTHRHIHGRAVSFRTSCHCRTQHKHSSYREKAYKNVCGNSFVSNRIFDRECPACSVHFQGISGLAMNHHCSFGFFRPCPANVTKLCSTRYVRHWSNWPDILSRAMLDSLLFCQFAVNSGTVWFQIK